MGKKGSINRNPKISIIVSAYNHGQFILETLESILNQSFEDFEIIALDNGSKDSTSKIMKSFSDQRVRYFRFETNQGISEAINFSLNQAKGEYICFFGSDDKFLPNKLKAQVTYLDTHKKVYGVFSYVQLIDEENRAIKENSHFYHDVFTKKNRSRYEWLNYFFYNGNCLCYSTACIRKSCFNKIGLNDRRLAQLHDFDMWVELAKSYEIHIIQEPLIQFRIRASNMNVSANTPQAQIRSMFEFAHVLKRFLTIQSVDEFSKIFPEETKKHKDITDNELIPFYVARAALDVPHVFHQKFALDTLYDLLQNKALTKKLDKISNFSYVDFMRLTGKYDFYHIEHIERQYKTIDDLHNKLKNMEHLPFQLKALFKKLIRINA